MAEKSFAAALNEQISNEFAASQQYVAAAVYYDAETLPRLAAFFYRQALEEREHAMMMIRYLLDTGEEVKIPDIKSVPTTYADGSEPVKMAPKFCTSVPALTSHRRNLTVMAPLAALVTSPVTRYCAPISFQFGNAGAVLKSTARST